MFGSACCCREDRDRSVPWLPARRPRLLEEPAGGYTFAACANSEGIWAVVRILRESAAVYGLGCGDPEIRTAGDTMMRRLLVGSAHYILGPFGPDTDLRQYGLRLCERGGKNAKKRAAVAVARKLAVLLHRLWVSGEVYAPLRQGMSATMTPAAA